MQHLLNAFLKPTKVTSVKCPVVLVFRRLFKRGALCIPTGVAYKIHVVLATEVDVILSNNGMAATRGSLALLMMNVRRETG